VKVSGQAFEAFSYYTMLTLSSTVDNCSSSSLSGTVKFDASGASPACASQVSAPLPIKFSLLPGTRTQLTTAVYAAVCTPSDPITVTVASTNDRQLGTAVATWTTGVTP
jgi:hypothetical protein